MTFVIYDLYTIGDIIISKDFMMEMKIWQLAYTYIGSEKVA